MNKRASKRIEIASLDDLCGPQRLYCIVLYRIAWDSTILHWLCNGTSAHYGAQGTERGPFHCRGLNWQFQTNWAEDSFAVASHRQVSASNPQASQSNLLYVGHLDNCESLQTLRAEQSKTEEIISCADSYQSNLEFSSLILFVLRLLACYVTPTNCVYGDFSCATR